MCEKSNLKSNLKSAQALLVELLDHDSSTFATDSEDDDSGKHAPE